MEGQVKKPPKIGNEITVRISLTFQEAPDVHTLLAMTPVRERGKLVRLALERYIVATRHPAGDVEQQIHAMSTWLRSRTACTQTVASFAIGHEMDRATGARNILQSHDVSGCALVSSAHNLGEGAGRSDSAPKEVDASSSSIKRWLLI